MSKQGFPMGNLVESSRVGHDLIQILYKSCSSQPIYYPLSLNWEPWSLFSVNNHNTRLPNNTTRLLKTDINQQIAL